MSHAAHLMLCIMAIQRIFITFPKLKTYLTVLPNHMKWLKLAVYSFLVFLTWLQLSFETFDSRLQYCLLVCVSYSTTLY